MLLLIFVFLGFYEFLLKAIQNLVHVHVKA